MHAEDDRQAQAGLPGNGVHTAPVVAAGPAGGELLVL